MTRDWIGIPARGIAAGIVGAASYWLACEVWPSSVAVALSMLAALLINAPPTAFGATFWVFLVLIKYNALMALSAASLPFAVPSYMALGLVMIAGEATASALVVSALTADRPGLQSMKTRDIALALLVGVLPAAILGVPGLAGLGAAIFTRLALGNLQRALKLDAAARLSVMHRVGEVAFYLGALGAWPYS